MTGLVYLIERIAPGLYFFCAAMLLFWLRRVFLARRRLAMVEFELERELAEEQQARAITWTLGTVEIALAIVAIAHVIAPTLRADLVRGGDGAGPAAAPTRFMTSTPGGDGNEVQAALQTVTAQALEGQGIQILLTAVASPTAVGTIVEGYPTPADCNSPEAQLEIPTTGQVLFDSVTVVGTANVANFAFYKFELAGPSTNGAFAPILGEKTSPVPEKGVLGQLPLSPFEPGNYQFRLAVFDNTGTLRASCTVAVVIRERPPTPTPPGGVPAVPGS